MYRDNVRFHYTKGFKPQLTDRRKRLIEEASRFFMSKHKIDSEVYVRGTLIKADVYGYCWVDSPFLIRIDLAQIEGLTDRRIVLTLAHEFVHAKQYHRLELINHEYDKYNALWKGKWYDFDLDYWNQPWEKEAHRRQDSLTDQFYRQYSD